MNMLRVIRYPAGLCVAALLVSSSAFAQQKVPFNNGIPVAPQGIAVPPLPANPVEYSTAEGQNIRVRVLVSGLTRPWSIAFLPGGDMLVTERDGKLRAIRGGKLDPQAIAGVPAVRQAGLGGLLDIALHPDFTVNRQIYLTYNKEDEEGGAVLAVARARFDGRALTNVSDIFTASLGTNGVSRLAFGLDGMLYVTTAGGNAQDMNSHSGKVLRLRDDGSVPADNPFVGMADHLPEIYTLGHRSTLGLAVHPGTGEIWQNENGPNGGDEINVLKPGGNYGWPLISLGRAYPGPWQSQEFSRPGFENPLVYWTPSIAVSGMTFYTGDALPKWKGDVFVGGLRTGEVPGTGHVERILFNEDMQELRRESLLVDLRRRIRDVRQGPDGLLYVLIDGEDGALLRIEPAD
jgi:glucose/arabinose dehydrogenase